MARSGLLSLLKSPAAMVPMYQPGGTVRGKSIRANATSEDRLPTEKYTTFEVPPPGVGLTAVMAAVCEWATSAALIVAFSVPETRIVARGDPVQFTTVRGTKTGTVAAKVNIPCARTTLGS